MSEVSQMRLFHPDGSRLYLTQEERSSFLEAAFTAKPEVRTFAETLVYSGCRISEALELVPKRVELSENRIILRSLKKRREDVFRAIPCPPKYFDTLNLAHNLMTLQKSKKHTNLPLWKWTRQHANEIIKKIMIEAKITEGKHRTPKGLRHAYGVHAVTVGIPLNMLQKWMGHASIQTTAIYANATGPEEINLASKMWK